MTTRMRLISVGAFLLVSAVASATAADTFDKRTTFTFNTPVAVPGVTLPAGSYLFRIADTDRHNVVQVLSGDGKTPYAMFFVLQAWRATPAADPELTFIETAADMPHAIRTWWGPGDSIGYDFLYPGEQARRLARGSGTPVRSIETEVPLWTEPTWAPPTVFGTQPPPAAVTEATAIAPDVQPEPAVEPDTVPAAELPTTASPLAVALATAIALVAMAAAMQMFTSGKRT